MKARAHGQWIPVLASLAPQLANALARPGHHGPCPVHGGSDGFRVFRDVEEKGGGVCNTCGDYSDGFALLGWVNGWTFREALAAVASDLGMSGEATTLPRKAPRPQPPTQTTPKPRDWARAELRRVSREAIAADHPDAEPLRRYLASRGILVSQLPEDLRFHRGLPYLHSPKQGERVNLGTFPTMLAVVRSPQGEAVTLHRTFLTPDGCKAAIAYQGEALSVKKLMPAVTQGATNGGAIRLFPAGPVLAVAEGIETAMSVHLDSGLPVWATVSAGGLERLELPPEVREVLIAADNDTNEVGQQAAYRLAKRLQAEGRRVRIAIPPNPGQDWNDVLKAARHGA